LREPVVPHFRRTLALEVVPASYPVRVSADNRFVLFVNGLCMGGGFALLLAAGHGFSAASLNYGGLLPKDTGDFLNMACPLVGSYGGLAKWEQGVADQLAKALDRALIPHDVKEYPDASRRQRGDRLSARPWNSRHSAHAGPRNVLTELQWHTKSQYGDCLLPFRQTIGSPSVPLA
jgi:hypothetical protein